MDEKDFNFLPYIQIDPKSIAPKGLGGFHFEEKETIGQKFHSLSDAEKKKIVEFVLNNHSYQGKGELPLPIDTFLPGIKSRPILTPKSYQVILSGLKRGLIYIVRFQLNTCPFLKDNLCIIHSIKPKVCKDFPFDKNGRLHLDDYLLKTCKGLKKNQGSTS